MNDRHIHHKSLWDGVELEVAAEVGLLTRNIKFYGHENEEWAHLLPDCDTPPGQDEDQSPIQTCFQNQWGDEFGSDQFGAHLQMHYIQQGRISNIEAFHVGQDAVFYRTYPLLYHKLRNMVIFRPENLYNNKVIFTL